MFKVEIITIGDELLIGQVIDTNSAWMAGELGKAGFDVQYKTTVGDNEKDILEAFELAFSRASIVLVTGGIGPTKDDITKKTLCKYFHTQLVFDEKTLETVAEVVRGLQKDLNELTRTQAYIPENCTVIQNRMGTAPITWFEKEGKILVSMPGVPYEMKWAMNQEIIPRLQKTFPVLDFIQHQHYWVKNYSESLLAMHLESFENELPGFIKLAYLPTSGLIRLRLTGKSSDKVGLQREMDTQRQKLLALLPNDIVSEEDANLENILDKLLKEKGLTLSVAESCTGGKLASLFTAIPGCSEYFMGGVVSYANAAKQHILGVNPSDLIDFGAVSEPVVTQMALGAQRIFDTDCAIATSGIAGPGGGTPEKPVGTVWIAAICKDKMKIEEFHFSQNRESNILRACNCGMMLLLELL
ncbi:MAG: CinA family nicotinamide mononucleotide deamidase-related protein [Candidatus Symbiothrix sp.]|nr:CinA family nicotinamide mononucleotide deamidase-related protein [Candidatus Symbiothrix sp.]